MYIKHNILFRLFSYGKKKDRFQIRMRVSFLGHRLDFATGYYINSPQLWDPETGLVTNAQTSHRGRVVAIINNELRRCRDTMEMVFSFFEVNEMTPTIKGIKEAYYSRLSGVAGKPKSEPDFFSAFDEFIQESTVKNSWSASTICRMRTFRREIMAFDKEISLPSLDEKKLTDFTGKLQELFSNSTVAKKLEYLRWFLNWAFRRGYQVNPAFQTYHPSIKMYRNTIVYLTQEELIRIRNLNLSHSHLDKTRDVFLFCCFSGLRYSDVSNLRRCDIKNDHLEITTVKTADSISIELNDVTKAILAKYQGVHFTGNKALPVLSNQSMNRRLKDLGKLAELNEEIRITRYKGSCRKDFFFKKWQLICTHTGRRTFIVQALSLGIPPSIVMKWTGHSGYRAMLPYIDIVDSAKAESMAKFNTLL